MRKIIYTLCLTVVIAIILTAFQWKHAQPGTISGFVKDTNGNPMPGASVSIKGNRKGTITDANGHFVLKLKPGTYTVIVTSIEHYPQQAILTVHAEALIEQNFTTTELYDLCSEVRVICSHSTAVRNKFPVSMSADINSRDNKETVKPIK